ncbi:MAG: hypothetical protein A3G32_09500 [Deltaproteobacteria bacterium RIFCSPLOWO2_12_FULL_40_28]|nr:MAG: hypothetical protein A3C45_07770 [Deltaproteobacteria bacterium RIFCSPHIGHO2_02_FULL_40_28]OGQ20536.1 MAG: hypothetical protein A3E27_02560 [Deltaproteobacteria bacterium RIFCSPHIGHO2_12_FULL_40_32]OGQ41187.1 MAG: hypothetical protein A3I69_07795 [Deltaproteobacteria bacterium RIFCSPLOWO2_02_FULL_40_36]OGQ55149.1 MAG: hypothetical protein A3G32_09500 [Deltaproteobacteria bacterium RIFCSPLOWO2_12_FULL_40_28]
MQKKPLKNPGKNPKSVNLYIHYPYCLYKCHYCDFNSYAWEKNSIPHREYVKALILELSLRNFPKSYLTSIFIGGGTPSLLPPADLEYLLSSLTSFFSWNDQTEITIEANPKTISKSGLIDYRNAGVNRISVGVQSLHDSYLGAFGRIHTVHDALCALEAVAQTGFTSWNADLMYGFPGQTQDEFCLDMEKLFQFDPPHSSCYALTVEKGTIYEGHVAKGIYEVPNDDLQLALMNWLPSFLESKGLHPYEISNFAKPGHESKHNLNYWHYGSYLGIGAGAVSQFHHPTYRTTNLKKPGEYLDAIFNGRSWFEKEEIPEITARGEFMMMGLRLKDGLDEENFLSLFSKRLEDVFDSTLVKLFQKGWIQKKPVRLTKLGLQFANLVASEFLTP